MIIRIFNIEWANYRVFRPKEIVIQLDDDRKEVTIIKGSATGHKAVIASHNTKTLKEEKFNPFCLPSILYDIFSCKVDGFEYEWVN